jgi:hypothetical protein
MEKATFFIEIGPGRSIPGRKTLRADDTAMILKICGRPNLPELRRA